MCSPWVPCRLLSLSSDESWSSNRFLLSYSSRPISVLLPSSTLPQVMKRRRGWTRAASVGGDVNEIAHQK